MMHAPITSNAPLAPVSDRAAALASVRAELRAEHRRLTDRQIDLIAEVAVELRLTRVRLGYPDSSAS